MASDEIKEAIVSYFDNTGVESVEKDWKRLSKRRLPDGGTVREFTNAKLGRTVYTLGDDEECDVVEKDVWIYGYAPAGNAMVGEAFLAFEPRDRWHRQGHMYDQHQSGLLSRLFGMDFLDEVCENQFVPEDGVEEAALRTQVEACGFIHDPDYSSFIAGGQGMHKPVPLTPAAPIDPPTPRLLVDGAKPPKGVGPAKSGRTREELPAYVHVDAVIAAILEGDPSIWDALLAARAAMRRTKEVPHRTVEVISPGVYGVNDTKTVETADPLYPDAESIRREVMDRISAKGRISRMHVGERDVVRNGTQVMRRMWLQDMLELQFTTTERDGVLVELSIDHVQRSGRGRMETITDFRHIRTTVPTTPTHLPPEGRTMPERYPAENEFETHGGDDGEEFDPSEFTGRIIFGWFEGDDDLLGFACGYETADGHMSDQYNVPEEAFKEVFPDRKGEWNASEGSHYLELKKGETMEQLEALVRERLTAAGCTDAGE